MGKKTARREDKLRENWKFHRGDPDDAGSLHYDDSDWENVDVPHDWAIKGPFNEENDRWHTAISADGQKKSREHVARTGGLPHVGTAWYRKEIQLPADAGDYRYRIEFDGVMSRSQVFCNGRCVGGWPYGYASFAFDLTDYLNPGRNVIAVRVENKEHASRWYPGAGIFRNVRLLRLAPVHFAHWGICATTPKVDQKSAVVKVNISVENHLGANTTVELQSDIIAPDGQSVGEGDAAKKIKAGTDQLEQEFNLSRPHLWSPSTPQLYKLRTTLIVDGLEQDSCETPFGIRQLDFRPHTGFHLNGEHVRFKGVCMHHDLGPLGSAFNAAALKRQLLILKEMGCNAIRTSHNPPAPELLDMTDRMGFLVIDEAFDEWKTAKCENGYNSLFDEWAEKDLRAMIRRDRNHPSVIMWSIGNEIKEQGDQENGAEIAEFLHNICHDEDPTRPTTAAFNNAHGAIENGLADVVDIPGWNYRPEEYSAIHCEHPDWPTYGSETASCISSRGEYYLPGGEERQVKRESLQINSYDLSVTNWSNCPDVEFRAVEENPFIMGEFVWTGFDYLGEPTPYYEEWPSRSSYFGIVDLCGIPKDRYYLYRSHWAGKDTLHLLPHWTWPGHEGETIPVHCYSSWRYVELFLNGVSQGVRRKSPKNLMERYRLVWNGVKYEPGELKAVVYDQNGEVFKEESIFTAGEPAGIRLEEDRPAMKADGDDMIFVCVSIIDDKGHLCPKADNLIEFDIKGPAQIAAVGNGNPASTEPFIADYRKAFNGKCMVYLRSQKSGSGQITLEASGKGLKSMKKMLSAQE